MSKADRFSSRFQEAQRKAAADRKALAAGKITVAPEVKQTRKPRTPANTGGSVIPNSIKSGWITFGSSTTTTTPITGTWNSSGTVTFFPEEGSAKPIKKPNHKPSDDITRASVERAVLAAIDDCLKSDHYPQGIALSRTAYEALKGSPLLGREGVDGFWQQPSGAETFLNIKLHAVDIDDPWFVEVGW